MCNKKQAKTKGFSLFFCAYICNYREVRKINIGKNLKYYREKKGYSKLKLSKEAGINRKTITEIENGINGNPTIETLKILAKPLETTLEELLK